MKPRITNHIYLLTICLLANAITSPALQSGDFTYTVNPDGITVTIGGYTGEGGAVDIPSTIDSKAVTAIGDSAFYFCSSLTSVTIPDSVTSIRSSAFDSCIGLNSVIIGNGVTSIGGGAFQYCTSLPAFTVATDNPAYSSDGGVLCDKSQTTILKCPEGFFGSYTIPDSVTSIGNSAFENCDSLASVTIPNSVTTIGSFAFQSCNSLTSVTIPDSITSIDFGTFYYCASLASITIPDSVTSIGSSAFAWCTSLTNVTIPDSVTSIGYSTFDFCTSLAAITVAMDNPTYSSDGGVLYDKSQSTLLECPEGFPGNCTIPDGVAEIEVAAFKGCTSLSSVTIPDTVTLINEKAFDSCTGLTHITMGNGLEAIGPYAFQYCTNLASITIPDSVIYIGNSAFRSCTSLAHLTISGSGSSIVIENSAFSACTSLTHVTIPGRAGYIGDYAFGYCTNLTTITMSNGFGGIGSRAFSGCTSLVSITIPDSVTFIGNRVFSGCASLAAITVATGNPDYSSIDGVLFDKSQTFLFQYPEGRGGSYTIPDGVTSIGDDAFRSCENLTHVTIPDSITTIGYDAFSDCSSLTAITVATNNPAYSSIGGVLFDQSQTTLILCPGGRVGSCAILDGVTFINYDALSACVNLTAITVATNNPAYSSIGGVLFDKSQTELIQCPGGLVGSYTIPDGITTIWGSAFSSCVNLTSIAIPDSITYLDLRVFEPCTSLTAITVTTDHPFYSSIGGVLFDKGQNTLIKCPGGLISYTIPDGVTVIRGDAFRDCKNLTNITIPDSVTAIGSSAFRDCENLTSVTIPDSVSEIWPYAFASCNKLTHVTIMGNATFIMDNAFFYSANLTGIYCHGNSPYTGSSVFMGVDHATIYYLPGTTGWSSPMFGDLPRVRWNPLIQTDDGSFGMQGGEFGFNIAGYDRELVNVEACTNLVDGAWEPVSTINLTAGAAYFSDPDGINHNSKYYRLNMP